jgi:hypothetical protein
MSSFDSIIDYIHHHLHSSIDHVILFMDTQINQWPHNKVHMSLSQGRGFRSDINRGVNGCHCHDRPYHGKFMFYQWIEIFNLTWWPKQNVYCRPWVSWYIYFILWSHILTHSLTKTHTHFKAQRYGDHTLSLMLFDVKEIMHFGNIGNVDLDHQIGYIIMTQY